ncbi:hypothetical protein BLNAU_19124 [Blattamonas nauphoetae]|uniref:Uncharacterized protein n=1 Tax=Blattamonas nauphoetae TaxID=2049346 RepID=A0ABQ9X2H3_9EUKA|nr:hypothetical protein BLNAU_19124 [Blattamonas nauphoetae]
MSGNTSTTSNNSGTALSEPEDMQTLTTLIASKREAGEEINWDDLMEWFVCAVIGLESAVLQSGESSWFDWDDVVVDGFGTTRIKLPASHSNSSPLHSPQSFSEAISHLSRLFLDLIDRFSLSDCLPKRIEQHFRDNVILSVLRHIIQYLVNTGHLVLTCEPSEFESIFHFIINYQKTSIPDETYFYNDSTWMTITAYRVIRHLEDMGIANPIERLTDPSGDFRSSQFEKISDLVHPAIVEVSQLFDPDLFEEARRISSWKEFLQKVVGEEEVQNDKSFLKLPFFRPTLLSLQAKFQQQTLSLFSSHTSPKTSLETHLDSSLQTISSSAHFKQESLQLLTILHSLLTAPLPASRPTPSPTDHVDPRFILFRQETVDLDEIFRSSLFDEPDNEILARSLVHCRSVCDLVGAEKCIRDLPEFVNRLVSVLGTSDSLVREAAFFHIPMFVQTPCVIPMFPRLWNQLRTAFRDGQLEEQDALLRISTQWIQIHWNDCSLPPFPATQFDWDGLISADLSDRDAFLDSVNLISNINHRSITTQIGKNKARSIILSFERRQYAVSRIATLFETVQQMGRDLQSRLPLISYCLLNSLLSNCAFPPAFTTILTQRPDVDAHTLSFRDYTLFFLCHTSLNRHKPHQPPFDLLFERTLRTHPLDFFLYFADSDLGTPPSLLNTSLCGFHALCRRGVHLDLMRTEDVRRGDHMTSLFWIFSTFLITDTEELFHYFPPPLVVRFFIPILSLAASHFFIVEPLKVMMTTLIVFTAPFGDCCSLRELHRSVDPWKDTSKHTSHESIVPTHLESLEWLNIPTGFESALTYSMKRESFDPSPELDNFFSGVSKYLPRQADQRKDPLSFLGSLARDLNRSSIVVK